MANFALEGPKWGSSGVDGTSGGQVTWSFFRTNFSSADFQYDRQSTTAEQASIRAAFAKWESVCNIDFVEVTDAEDVEFRLGWDEIDGGPVPGQPNTLGECQFTFTGGVPIDDAQIVHAEVRFDIEDTFSSDELYAVALHEIGHGIGFGHYDDTASIMITFTGTEDLTSGDIAGAVAVYGGVAGTVFAGGPGDDSYTVRNTQDVVNEAVGEGNDTVRTTVSYALKAGSEIEVLLTATVGGTTAINLTGNEFAQTIRGNNGANILKGLGGNDVLVGNAGNDTLDGGAGVDTMNGGLGNDSYAIDAAGDKLVEASGEGSDTARTTVSYTLKADIEIEALVTATVGGTAAINLTGNEFGQSLRGNAGVNVLSGRGGNDVLNGGAGADTMRGGLGNDTFRVDNAGDVVVEAAGEGNDVVGSSVSYALSADAAIERLTTDSQAGTAAINLNGSSIGQAIDGNDGKNRLVGLGGNDDLHGFGGNDRLYGGSGNDTLAGGTGSDIFVFRDTLNATTNLDTITDFNVAADTVHLENAIFTALSATGTLAAGAFKANATGLATQSDDRIIYETDTGKLFYDTNGNADGGAIQFALLTANLALTNNDFMVI